DGLDADFLLDGLDAADPDSGFLVALFRLSSLVTVELFRRQGRSATIAVMRLVVDDDDLLLRTQLATDATDHLVVGLAEDLLVLAAEHRLRQSRRLHLLPTLE